MLESKITKRLEFPFRLDIMSASGKFAVGSMQTSGRRRGAGTTVFSHRVATDRSHLHVVAESHFVHDERHEYSPSPNSFPVSGAATCPFDGGFCHGLRENIPPFWPESLSFQGKVSYAESNKLRDVILQFVHVLNGAVDHIYERVCVTIEGLGVVQF